MVSPRMNRKLCTQFLARKGEEQEEQRQQLEARDHPGASSGSIVHSSGKPAFSASPIVCCSLVSAISNVYTPATAIPCVCACNMIAVASASDLANTSRSTSTTNSIGV